MLLRALPSPGCEITTALVKVVLNGALPVSWADVICPFLHQLCTGFYEVTARVGHFRIIADVVGQSGLCGVSGSIGLLTNPVPKTTPETVSHSWDPQAPQQGREGHI